MILSPTRELAMQTFGVLRELMQFHSHTFGLIMGGADRKTEAAKLSKGKILSRAIWLLLLLFLIANTPRLVYYEFVSLFSDLLYLGALFGFP